jgi:hypothetical protein
LVDVNRRIDVGPRIALAEGDETVRRRNVAPLVVALACRSW